MKKFLKLLVGKTNTPYPQVSWEGDYKTWEEASSLAKGYDQNNILEKVKAATAAVRDGIKAYERDSVTFDKVSYSWPLITALLWLYSREGKVHIIDFGGSLGSSFFQNKLWISDLENLTWNVIEQPSFVKIGRESFEKDNLKFYNSMKECMSSVPVNAVLFSSVLQYLPNPYDVIRESLAARPQIIIFDRLSIIERNSDRITIQTVPATIYEAVYPSRFFSKTNIIQALGEDYELIFEDDAYVPNFLVLSNNEKSSDRVLIFKLRS